MNEEQKKTLELAKRQYANGETHNALGTLIGLVESLSAPAEKPAA